MKIILRLLVVAAVAFLLAQWLPGVKVDNYLTAIWFAAVLGLLNVFLKPILVVVTIPITILTLGIFLFFINTITVLIASNLVPGFTIDSFWHGVLFSFLLSLTTSVLFREEDRQREQE